MCGIGHSHAFLTAFRLHGRDVEDKVGIFNPLACFRRSFDLTVLAKSIADSTNVQMFFGNFHFATHRVLAVVFAIRVGIATLEKHLILFAFSTQADLFLRFTNSKGFAPIIDGFGQDGVVDQIELLLCQLKYTLVVVQLNPDILVDTPLPNNMMFFQMNMLNFMGAWMSVSTMMIMVMLDLIQLMTLGTLDHKIQKYE